MYTTTCFADDSVRIHSLLIPTQTEIVTLEIRVSLYFEIEFEWASAQQTNPIDSAIYF